MLLPPLSPAVASHLEGPGLRSADGPRVADSRPVPHRDPDTFELSPEGVALAAEEGREALLHPGTEEGREDLLHSGNEAAGQGLLHPSTLSLQSTGRDDPSAPDESGGMRGADGEPLTREETAEVRELQARDREVRAHEEAHKAAAGHLALGGPTYEYERGPDGREYAVGGEVQIDTSREREPHSAVARPGPSLDCLVRN